MDALDNNIIVLISKFRELGLDDQTILGLASLGIFIDKIENKVIYLSVPNKSFEIDKFGKELSNMYAAKRFQDTVREMKKDKEYLVRARILGDWSCNSGMCSFHKFSNVLNTINKQEDQQL